MLKIRMQRTGRTNDPAYRIVVTEHTRGPKSGKFVERLGSYNPKTKARTLDNERVSYWLSVGAKASGTMHNMLVSAGVVSGKKVNVLPRKSPPKKKEVEAEAAPAAAPASEAAPAAEEVKTEETASPAASAEAAEGAEEASAETPAEEQKA